MNGPRIVSNFVLAKPYTTVLNPRAIQAGLSLATSRNGSFSKGDVVLFKMLIEKGKDTFNKNVRLTKPVKISHN
jgi:hypothetical protein